MSARRLLQRALVALLLVTAALLPACAAHSSTLEIEGRLVQIGNAPFNTPALRTSSGELYRLKGEGLDTLISEDTGSTVRLEGVLSSGATGPGYPPLFEIRTVLPSASPTRKALPTE